MVNIPDWGNEPLSNRVQSEADKAEIEAYLAQWHQEREQKALCEFEQIPSYAERFRDAARLHAACQTSGYVWSNDDE